jgi:transposase
MSKAAIWPGWIDSLSGGTGRGQPAYDPPDLLKLYPYGDMNRIRSGHRLEQECQHNIEPIWLLGGLRPGYHGIANFRRDNVKALKAVNFEFVKLCRELDLIGGKYVGIDGSFCNASASASADSVKTLTGLERDLARLDPEMRLRKSDPSRTPSPHGVPSAR